jgi:glycosyltransferase involved in cell wall biosynthesis
MNTKETINFKVIIISNYLPDEQDSMLKFSELIHTSLTNNNVNVETIRPVERAGKLKFFFPSIVKWLFYIDKYLLFPIYLLAYFKNIKLKKNIVYHITDHSNALYALFLKGQPLVVTCHDVLAIRSAIGEINQNPTGFTGRLLQKYIFMGLKSITRIVCVSEKTARDLHRLIGDHTHKVTTILNPLNFDYFPLSRENAILKTSRLGDSIGNAIQQGFILHVGGNQWYKNRFRACEIYAFMAREKLRRGVAIPQLLLAGKEPSAEIRSYVSENSDLPIRFVISPTTDELQALYSVATALLFPSLEEGFGWPILEAMACGCPVVTTGKPPMTQVGGDAAIYIDPTNIYKSAYALNEVTDWSNIQRSEHAQKGYTNLERFSKSEFIDHYLAAYSDVVKA